MRRSLVRADHGARKPECAGKRLVHVRSATDHRARTNEGFKRHRAPAGHLTSHRARSHGRWNARPFRNIRARSCSPTAGATTHVPARRRSVRPHIAGTRGWPARGGGAAGHAAARQHQRSSEVAR